VKQLIVALALAYIMPSYSVLRRLTAGRDEMTVAAVKAEGAATVAPVLARDLSTALGATWTSGELPLAATLQVRFPGRCRLDLTVPDSGKAVTVAWTNGKHRAEGPALPAALVAIDQLCATLALRSATEGESRAALEHHLASLKVDTQKVSLGRFEGSVVYVLGDRAEGSAQFQVYKDRFAPARVKLTEGGVQWDVRFIDYTSQATGDWLPRVVEVYRGAELNLRVTVLSADGHASLDGVKF
jgi:autotransporter translocation and assembly factor TamB